MHYGEIEKKLAFAIESAVGAALSDINAQTSSILEAKVELEIPKDKSHGDLSSNIALKTSKIAKRSPVDFANIVKAKLEPISHHLL